MSKSIIFIPFFIVVQAAFFSCNNNSTGTGQPPEIRYASPTTQPLKVSTRKLDKGKIKSFKVHPPVKKFDLDKLPVTSYDTSGFKPFKYPVGKVKFDFKSLPSKDLDVDRLPSTPLKFITQKLAPPKLIKSGIPHLKDANQFLYQLGLDQGLEGGLATCLMTDHHGFLWIATDKALYRYDGNNLWFYMPINGTHYIAAMVQDKPGRIWMTTSNNGSLVILDPRAGVLQTAGKSSGLTGRFLGGLTIDSKQRIWVAAFTSNGVAIIDAQMQTVRWLNKAHHLSDTLTERMVQDSKHNIWITNDKGVDIIDLEHKKIKYFDKQSGLGAGTPEAVLFDRDGNLWVGFYDGLLNVIDFKNNSIESIKEIQKHGQFVMKLSQDRAGRIWAATGDGAEVFDRAHRAAKNIKQGNGQGGSFAGNFVFDIAGDQQGQQWIGTDGGLNMVSGNPAVIEKIGKTRVNIITEDPYGLVWDLGVGNGLSIIDRKNKTSRHLGAREGLLSDTAIVAVELNGKTCVVTASGLDIIDRKAKTITEIRKTEGYNSTPNFAAADKKGRLWIGTLHGIDIFDPATNRVTRLDKTCGFNDGQVDIMCADDKGQVWAAMDSGKIDVIDGDNLTIKNFYTSDGPFEAVGGAGIFMPGKNGNMWVGVFNGLHMVDAAEKTLTTFSVPQGLIDERVASVAQRGNQIYVGTVGGISIITPPADLAVNKKWGIQSFGGRYGLHKLNLSFPMTDALSSDGKFLFGDFGVTVFDPAKADTSRPPAYISGITIMDRPGNFTGSAHTVTDGHAWDGVGGPFNLPVNLQLPHDQNNMQFTFTTLNLAPHDTTWYNYRLVGKDTSWSNKTTSDQSNIYFNLAPGAYTFEVVSRNSDSAWGNPATFSFTINPAWWQTWWAYILYVALFAGIIWCFVTYRSYQLVKEKRVLEHKVHVRTEEVMQQKEEIEAQRDNLERSFTELKNAQTRLVQSEKMASLGELTAGIAHEIQNPLNFVNNFSEVNREMLLELKAESEKPKAERDEQLEIDLINDLIGNEEKISHHGKRADSIVKGMLEHSRSSSGQKEPTDINAMADEFIRLSYHGLRAKDKSFNANLVTHFDAGLPKINLVQQEIGRVLLNLFNNAFYAVNQKKKTAAEDYKPEVSISTSTDNGQVIIKVKDNGNGIPDAIKEKIMQPFFTTKPTGEGTGLGLSLSYDIVVKGHGGNIQVNSVEGEGSEFIIQIPAD